MEIILIGALAMLLVAAGCAATFAVAGLLPLAVIEGAQRNGRFAGLGASTATSRGGPGGRARVPAAVQWTMRRQPI